MKTFAKQFVIALTIVACSALWAAQEKPAEKGKLKAPAQSVLEHHLKIQTALTEDSLKGVPDHATQIAKVIREDQGKTISIKTADQADKLAKAQDLKTARQEFKPLSQWLTVYLTENNIKNTGYIEASCPMEKAVWLQKGKKIQNPYMGRSMPTCGKVDREF